MVNNLKSIYSTINFVNRNLNLNGNFNEEDFIEYIADASRFIGSYQQLVSKEEILCINNYKSKFPCDYYEFSALIDHFIFNNEQTYIVFFNQYFQKPITYLNKVKMYEELVRNEFLGKYIKYNKITEKDFRIEHNHIYTSFEKGFLRLHYKAIPVDENQYPLVPDDEAFDTACMWYIAQYLSLQGKIKIDFQLAQLNWKKYCNQARGNFNMPNTILQDIASFRYNNQPYIYG